MIKPCYGKCDRCVWKYNGGYHLCPKCYSAWRNLKKQAESENDNG